jgi:hypothetical protein
MKRNGRNGMDDENGNKSCVRCKYNIFCMPYADMREALAKYNLITKHPGKVWAVVVEDMAEMCRYFAEDK